MTTAILDRRVAAGGLTILALVVAGLLAIKWTGAFGAVTTALATHAVTPKPPAFAVEGVAAAARPLVRTANYLAAVWKALAFGVLIGAAVRAFVSPAWIARLVGRGSTSDTILAGCAASPLMLCSCCVAPIFSTIYRAGARLGPALAVMIGSPTLNLAALTLTFVALGPHAGVARLATAMALTFGATAILGRLFPVAVPAGGALDAPAEPGVSPRRPFPLALVASFTREAGAVAVRTVPGILLGVLVSSYLLEYVPFSLATGNARFVVVVLAATLAVPIAMPTFFEIPIAVALVTAGAPLGAAVAVTLAGPAINLASLLTVARETSTKVALATAFAVWLVAVAAGLAVGS